MASSVVDLDGGKQQIRFSPEALESVFAKTESAVQRSGDGYLLVRDRDRWGDVLRLRGGETFRIGRSSKNDYSIVDDRSSRHHCELYQQAEVWYVRDLGSRNGTRVNGKKIAVATPLKSGDRLRVGRTKLMFTNDLSRAMEVDAGGDSDSELSQDTA